MIPSRHAFTPAVRPASETSGSPIPVPRPQIGGSHRRRDGPAPCPHGGDGGRHRRVGKILPPRPVRPRVRICRYHSTAGAKPSGPGDRIPVSPARSGCPPCRSRKQFDQGGSSDISSGLCIGQFSLEAVKIRSAIAWERPDLRQRISLGTKDKAETEADRRILHPETATGETRPAAPIEGPVRPWRAVCKKLSGDRARAAVETSSYLWQCAAGGIHAVPSRAPDRRPRDRPSSIPQCAVVAEWIQTGGGSW